MKNKESLQPIDFADWVLIAPLAELAKLVPNATITNMHDKLKVTLAEGDNLNRDGKTPGKNRLIKCQDYPFDTLPIFHGAGFGAVQSGKIVDSNNSPNKDFKDYAAFTVATALFALPLSPAEDVKKVISNLLNELMKDQFAAMLQERQRILAAQAQAEQASPKPILTSLEIAVSKQTGDKTVATEETKKDANNPRVMM